MPLTSHLYLADDIAAGRIADLLVAQIGFEPLASDRDDWREVRSDTADVLVRPDRSSGRIADHQVETFGFASRTVIAFVRRRNADPADLDWCELGSVALILETFAGDAFLEGDGGSAMLQRLDGQVRLFNREQCWTPRGGREPPWHYLTMDFTWSDDHAVTARGPKRRNWPKPG